MRRKGEGGHVYVHNVSRYVAEKYYDKPARAYPAKSQAVTRWPGREKIGERGVCETNKTYNTYSCLEGENNIEKRKLIEVGWPWMCGV